MKGERESGIDGGSTEGAGGREGEMEGREREGMIKESSSCDGVGSVYLEPLVNAFLVELMITWSESPDPLPHLEITHTPHN